MIAGSAKATRNTLLVFSLLLVLVGCKRDIDIRRDEAYRFPDPIYRYEGGAPKKAIAALGAKLFFDPILSSDSTVSCVSCHAPEHAFASHNDALSRGVNGKLGIRNSPSLANMIYYPNFGWDGGILNLEIQPITPITDTLEMHSSFPMVREKLSAHPSYPEAFKVAFGKDSITDKQILVAITQYVAQLVSNRSKYDLYLRGLLELSADEEAGLALFKENCETCHSGILFTNFDFYRNGHTKSSDLDSGRYRITQDINDKGKFRVPSLRNVALTYPYLHDGSAKNLDSVLTHYAKPLYENELPNGAIKLSDDEQQKVITFLRTLTDYQFISDPKHLPNY